MSIPSTLRAHEYSRFASASTFSLFLSLYAFAKKKLTPPASVVAFFIGQTCACSSVSGFASLLSFFLLASKATKTGAKTKKRFEEHFEEEGNRNISQVLCNSAAAVVMIAIDAFLRCHQQKSNNNSISISNLLSSFASELYSKPASFPCRFAVVAHFSACCGDTFASELGQLDPRLTATMCIPPFKTVPKGTNGAVTTTGTGASALGGLGVALAVALAEKLLCPPSEATMIQTFGGGLKGFTKLVSLCVIASTVGSMLDSLLGAVFQFTGSYVNEETGETVITHSPARASVVIRPRNWLSNDHVNLISVGITTAAAYFYGKRFV